MIALSFLSTNVYAGGGVDANVGGNNGGNADALIGGPNEDRTGWIYYLVDRDTKKQVSRTATYVCNSTGIVYPHSTKLIENPILRLKSRFGVEPDMQDMSKNPSWGRPYKISGYKAISRNKEIKQHLLQKIDTKYNGVSIGKRERAFSIILETFGLESAIDWYNQKTMLVYEPFYWHSVHKGRKATKDYICATSYRLGIYQQGIESSLYGEGGKYGDFQIALFTNDVYANCIKLEKGRSTYKNRDKFLGLYIPSKLTKYTAGWLGGGALMSNADMANASYGYGICMVWNSKKPIGIINTYDGSHSPGKPESTSKKKNTTGRSEIIKQYWVKETDANGNVEYKNVGAETHKEFDRDKTTKNIQITDEIDKPTEKTTKGYKLVGWFTGHDLLVGWFTGHDLNDSTKVNNIDNPRPNGELKSRMAEADNEGFRSGKGEDLITLTLDKVTKKTYKGEDTLVVVFLREEKTDGIIDTYNHKDSPGDPENPSNDKTKQGKKKILKQYWDEIEVYKNGIKTETKYKHVGTYKEDNVVKHVKVTEEPKEYKIIGWFTGDKETMNINPKPKKAVE